MRQIILYSYRYLGYKFENIRSILFIGFVIIITLDVGNKGTYVNAMRHNRLFHIILVALLLVSAVTTAEGIKETPQNDPSSSSTSRSDRLLPFRDTIRHGRLPNGMEYYLQQHPHPEDTVTIRLIVDAGSVLETEEQRGLAHFVEHMAFNGTRDFDENELVAYLERLGIQFGPDVNAYTSFDETVYRLDLPARDDGTLTTGFRVMSQWAGAISFESDAIERERGVIVEEWRGGQNAAQRMLRQHMPVLLAESRYARRLPIGEMEVVRNAPRSEFLDFYRRWYRPDNMAVVVAGDISTDTMERLVREYFSGIPRPATSLDRPYYHVPIQEEVRASIATDEEAQRSTVAIYRLQPPQSFETEGDYRRILVRSLFASTFNERIRDISREPDAPIVQGGVGWNRFLRDTEIAVASVVVRDDRITDALTLLATELYRVEQHGFLPDEVDRARRRLLQSIDEALVNRESRNASALADELVRHWTEGEAVPGIEEEHRLYRRFVPEITVAEVNDVIREFLDDRGRVILGGVRVTEDGTLPGGGPVPEEQELIEIVENAGTAHLDRWESAQVGETLLPNPPVPGAVESEIYHEAVDTTELRLSNGMRVFLKPTDYKEDEILFSAYSPGGLALVEDELVATAQLASAVADASGIGEIDAPTLEKILAGSSVTLSTSISRVAETISGSSRSEDLETLLQLAHLVYTRPRFDANQLENLRRQTIQRIEGSLASPTGQFGRRLEELFASGNPRLRSPQVDEVSSITIENTEQVFRERFSRPEDFALFFVGTFEIEEMRRLAATYLASIPPGGEIGDDTVQYGFVESIPDSFPLPPRGIVEETVRAGSEPVGRTVILVHGPYEWSREENHRFNSLADLLDIRLREAIREEVGGSYSVGAAGWRWRRPEPWSFMQLAYGMDPERSDELVDIVYSIVDEVRREAPSRDYLERITAQQRERYRIAVQDNGYWLSNLQFSVQHGRDPADIPDFPKLIDSLTPEDIRSSAERFLDPARRIQLILLPEGE